MSRLMLQVRDNIRAHYSTPLLIVIILLTVVIPVTAQPDCGYVDGISYPINPGIFALAQDYAIASPRHQGRFHTGEDWYGGRDISLGQPVAAAARGRVTYSFPRGWGRDGGVVIIEHTFRDGSIFYTQYGHMQETGSYTFPTRLSCVEQGQIIGAIADVRPAPHLHFEVRVANGDTPGAGYTRETPYSEGYRDPNKFILNQQAWLHLAHRWHITIGTESAADERGILAPPLLLNDNSLLYLDGTGSTLRRATNDGRILWRARLDIPAVAITGWQGTSLLTLRDGTMQQVNVETGALGESWQVNAEFTAAPIVRNNDLIFPATNNTLVAVGANRREILWQAENIPPFIRAHVTDTGVIALLTADYQMLLLSHEGALLGQTQLRGAASFATSANSLLALTRGGLWQVDYGNNWTALDAAGGEDAALLQTNERLYVVADDRITAYNREYQHVWQAGLPTIYGLVDIAQYDNVLLLMSNQGQIILVNDAGGFCNQLQIYGNADARLWHALGSDNILRLALADQIIALDWNTLIRPCNV